MKNRLLSIFLFGLFSFTSIAQDLEVSGIVVSSDFNKPIPFAHISVKDETIGTIADLMGAFALRLVDREDAILVVSAIGFETIQIHVSSTWNKKIALKPLIRELDEVVVFGKKIDLDAKDLVLSTLKKASKINSKRLLEFNIMQYGLQKGKLTRLIKHKDVNLTRKESIPWSVVERSLENADQNFDAGINPVGWHLLTPYGLLSNDIYTVPKLNKGNSKYTYNITAIDNVDGKETLEISVLQVRDTTSRESVFKNDLKFYFDDSYNLIQFKRRQLLVFDHGYNHMYMYENLVANYDNDLIDPLRDISINTIEHIIRFDDKGNKLEDERNEMNTIGSVQELEMDDPVAEMSPIAEKVLSSLLTENKYYLVIHWSTNSVLYDNRVALFNLLERYDFSKLEIVSVASPLKKWKWLYESQSYPLYTHFYISKSKEKNGTIQLYRGKKLLETSSSVSDRMIDLIKNNK